MFGNLPLPMMLPLASRPLVQPSSTTMYWYPALAMPLDTMASAIPRTVASSNTSWNLFQLFQPMGGVRARPLSGTSRKSGGRDAGGVGLFASHPLEGSFQRVAAGGSHRDRDAVGV